MRHLKFVSALAVLLVMTSSPVVNCMSTLYKMSMQEMACCKHMMSDGCDMGQGHESCCQTNSNPSVAAATHPTQIIDLDTGATVLASIANADSSPASSYPRITKADDGLPPPAPPGDISILKI
jgi:hypothetical protein